MGGKKKNKKASLNDKVKPFAKANISAPARNLAKSDLGAVIFGCKNHTIKECYSKELFGLPAPHYAYVKNIYRGLVLFLFNYSDRTLHGIFEADSHGQMNLDHHAWTDDGAELTPYPAQVKVRIQRRCCTLTEDQFRPIISSNYYEQSLFWFELDRSQTSKLVSLFSSLSYDAGARASTLKNKTSWNTFSYPLPLSNTRQEGRLCLSSNMGVVSNANTSISQKAWTSLFKSSSHDDDMQNDGSSMSIPQKAWSSLFKATSDSDGMVKDEIFWTEASNSCHPFDESKTALESLCSNKERSENEGGVLGNTQGSTDFDNWETYWDNPPPLNRSERQTVEVDVGQSYNKQDEDGTQSSESSDCSSKIREIVSENNNGMDATSPSFSAGADTKIVCSPTADGTTSNYSDISAVVFKLMQEIEALKGSQLKQIMKINYLGKELVDSKKQIAQLKNRCNMLESGEFSSGQYEWLNASSPDMDGTILIVGGSDGSSWLADLNSYSLSSDIMTSLCSMTTRRSQAAAAKLGGELYIFGGVDGDVWYDTVESYNLISEQLVSRPSLNRKKGSLAGVCLNDKIFAIGGGNGVDCFSEVELYDPNIGRWFFTQSMQYKRFSPAASEMNNAIYVTGGFDGTGYLSTVERFDPREHSWVVLANMGKKRGCHSVVVLNNKLYALGGSDGGSIHSTVEIFDPRMNSWMIGESMNSSRGYFGSAVVGDKIYAIGGIKEKGEISDTIECYKEGYGWELTKLNALGKRCFFSALVL